MFDLGMGEMAVIGIVALIVVGPKELPNLFRTVGNFVGKAQGMAREFSRAMNAAANDAGVKDIKDSLNGANQMMKAAANPKAYGAQKLRDATSSLTGAATPEETAEVSERAQEINEKVRAATQAGMTMRAEDAAKAKLGMPDFGPLQPPPPVTPMVTPAVKPVVEPSGVPLPAGAQQPQSPQEEPSS